MDRRAKSPSRRNKTKGIKVLGLLVPVEVRWIGCLTAQSTIFQFYMWWHIDVETDWRRSLTYGRVPTVGTQYSCHHPGCNIVERFVESDIKFIYQIWMWFGLGSLTSVKYPKYAYGPYCWLNLILKWCIHFRRSLFLHVLYCILTYEWCDILRPKALSHSGSDVSLSSISTDRSYWFSPSFDDCHQLLQLTKA